MKKRTIRWKEGSPNRITYAGILDYLKDKESTKNKNLIRRVLDFNESIGEESASRDTLLDLRNHTPFAHGFEGVSKEKIERIYKIPEGIAGDFRKILKEFNIKVESYNSDQFPFRLINEYLKEKIKRS